MCSEDSNHLPGGCSGCNSDCECLGKKRTFRRMGSSRLSSYFRLGSLVLLIVLISLPHQSVCTDSVENASLISQSEVKTIEPTNNPTKVFVRRRIFRKLVKDSSANNATLEETTTTTPKPSTPQTLLSQVKRAKSSGSSTVTGNMLKSSMQSSQSLASKQKFNFQSLKTRLGLAATTEESSTTNSSTPSPMVMIPLPPNQRKPYTPVIMQVSKSTTSKPETKVQTFKLNKMFVPIGIYGKVVENATAADNSTASTEQVSSSTPIPSIRHKGTDDKKRERKVKGIADSVDLTYAKPNLKSVSLTTERPDIGSISITTEANELFSNVFGGLTGNGVRRGDPHNRYGGKKPFSSNSGLTLMTPPALGSSDSPSSLADSLASYASYASYSPSKHKYSPSSLVDSIKDSMSNIPSLVPSLFHKGLTSLASLSTSLKENPFVDDNFSDAIIPGGSKKKPLISAPSSYSPKIPASVPGGYISGLNGGYHHQSSSRDQAYAGSDVSGVKAGSGLADLSEYETLEYFRKRPHLLAQLQAKHRGSNWRRSQGVRFSKGFKPANAPDPIAREYYKSTSTTTATTPEKELLIKAYNNIRQAKKMRGGASWLLRNSDEYVANKNDRLVRMWKNLFDSYSNEGAEDRMATVDNVPEQSASPSKQSQATLQSRRSSPIPKRNPVLSAHWSNIKSKYSKDQIDEAKERILTLLNSGYGDEAILEEGPEHHEEDHELQHVLDYDTHMPPPPPPKLKALTAGLTKGLSGAAAGAFKDLVKFFKLGVSVGTGQAHEPVNYEQVVDAQEEQELGPSASDWKPVRQPLISFSAGISLKNPLRSHKPHHHHHHDHGHGHGHHHHHHVEEVDLPPSHYSGSSAPYIPPSYKGLNHYIDELASSGGPGPTSPSYSSPQYEHLGPQDETEASPADYQDDIPPQSEPGDEEGYATNPVSSYASPSSKYRDSQGSYSYDQYRTLKPIKQSARPRPSQQQAGDMEESTSDWAPVRSTASAPGSVVYNPAFGASSEYELVPSSVYLNGAHDPRDIAAVVKPAGVSDDMVRSVLPAGLRNLRILDYPNEYASLNSVSQVLSSGGSAKDYDAGAKVNFKAAMKKLRENYVAKESAYLPSGGIDSMIAGLGGAGSNILSNYYSPALSNYYSQQPLQYQQALLGGGLGGLDIGTNVYETANRLNNNRGSAITGLYGSQAVSVDGKDSLGFTSNYNLPQNMDPDIAAILKSELDKDDIPEDVRQEFLEAKREEQKKAQQKQAAAAAQAAYQANRRVDLAQQSMIDSLLSTAKKAPIQQYTQQQRVQPTMPSMQSRAYTQYSPHPHQHQPYPPHRAPPMQHSLPLPNPPVISTRFFAPIPITPTLMTMAMKNPRYSSPVPRYVIELAKKLQSDKSVQGIVRVSAKRGKNLPPIEYLYPVKG